MPDEKPQDSSLFLLIAGAAVLLLLSAKPSAGPNGIGPQAVTAKVFPSLKVEYKKLCVEAAELVEKKELANEESLLKWLAPKTAAARDASFGQFYQMMDKQLPTTFEGKEKEVAEFLRKVGEAW
jgi:hypothetical protein